MRTRAARLLGSLVVLAALGSGCGGKDRPSSPVLVSGCGAEDACCCRDGARSYPVCRDGLLQCSAGFALMEGHACTTGMCVWQPPEAGVPDAVDGAADAEADAGAEDAQADAGAEDGDAAAPVPDAATE